MRSCLNGGTTGAYPLAEDIRAAAAAGFSAIELWYDKLTEYLAGHRAADVRRLLRDHQLAVAGICALPIEYGDGAIATRQAIAQAAEVAAEIACPTLVVLLRHPPAHFAPQQALEQMATEMAEVADLAAAHDINLAIEPLAGHRLVPGPRQALEVAELAGRPNVGTIFDTFHSYKAGLSPAEVAALPVEKLLLVHVNDAEDRPRDELTDYHRLYPTLGVIPAAEMLRPLVAIGYQGFLSVEVVRHEYFRRPIDEIAGESRFYLDRLLEQIADSGERSRC